MDQIQTFKKASWWKKHNYRQQQFLFNFPLISHKARYHQWFFFSLPIRFLSFWKLAVLYTVFSSRALRLTIYSKSGRKKYKTTKKHVTSSPVIRKIFSIHISSLFCFFFLSKISDRIKDFFCIGSTLADSQSQPFSLQFIENFSLIHRH